jgi:HD superfamily phosphohydrolase
MNTLLHLFSLLLFFTLGAEELAPITVSTLYGVEVIEEPLILELLASPAMQRLKEIDQSGIVHYYGKVGPYSRYDHSLGVFLLLKRLHVPLQEQVAGLLHDVSHTVFSHTGDWLFFQGSHEHSYQDDIHAWYLERQGIESIVAKYGMTLKEALAKGNGYTALEQELPDVCADRLEYNLFTGHLTGLLTDQDVNRILTDLHFEDGLWYFEDPWIAAQFAKLSLYFTENLWGAAWNALSNECCARAIKRALELSILTFEEIHFSYDRAILEKLQAAQDELIQEWMKKCAQPEKYFIVCAPEEADYSCFCKFRGIDPLVKMNGSLVRLTSIDGNFAMYYRTVKNKISKGVHVKFADCLYTSSQTLSTSAT